jgi:pilus assembly protein Flp/PilA
MIDTIHSVLVDDEGQGLAEYGLILGLIALVVIGAVILIGKNVAGVLSNVGNSI